MRLIITENKGLLNRVLDKIRTLRADGKKGVFDKVKGGSVSKDKASNKQ